MLKNSPSLMPQKTEVVSKSNYVRCRVEFRYHMNNMAMP